MKKRVTSKITYKMSDCKISHIEDFVYIKFEDKIVCVITKVKDYKSTFSLIRCMFQGGLMYAKISTYELKRMYKNTIKSNFLKKVDKVVEEVVDTVKSADYFKFEKTLQVVKKWIDSGNNLFLGLLKNVSVNSIEYKDPIQNLRFKLH